MQLSGNSRTGNVINDLSFKFNISHVSMIQTLKGEVQPDKTCCYDSATLNGEFLI